MISREKGFTLIEILVSLSISGIFCFIIAGGIFQIIRNSERNSNHMNAILQVQNTGYRISQDIRQAQSINTSGLLSGELLVIEWVDNDGDEYRISYNFEDIAGSSTKSLFRNLSVNDTDNSSLIIAGNIDPDPVKTSCNLTDGLFSITVTSVIGTGTVMESETKIFRIIPRPG